MGPCFFFQAEDGIRDIGVTGVQTCALPIFRLADVNKESLPFDIGQADFLTKPIDRQRSEERRVGKECSYRWRADDDKKNKGVAPARPTHTSAADRRLDNGPDTRTSTQRGSR